MTRLARQQKIIFDYGEGPNLLEKALTGLSEANLDISPLDDGWTIRKIVHHVASSIYNGIGRYLKTNGQSCGIMKGER
jgi:hypothetical protein